MPDFALTINMIANLQMDMGCSAMSLKYHEEALEIYRDLFRRYPSTYAWNLLTALMSVVEVYDKLEMEDSARLCREEIKKIERLLS